MQRIRRRVILLILWLVGFCGVDSLLGPVDISLVAYVFLVGMMIFSLVAPQWVKVHYWALVVAPIPIFYVIRILAQPLVDSTAILLSILEGAAILVTILLSYRVSLGISELELAIAHLGVGQHEHGPGDASLGAGALYREVRRSRNHHRPLALLAVAIDETALQMNIDRIVQDAQRTMIKQYALSATARLLCDRLEDCDTIVQNNEHFLILLPETMPDDLPGLIERLRRECAEQIGVELKIGAASLPEDGYTLEGLVDQASRGIKTDLAPEFFLELRHVSANQQIS